MVVLVFMYVSDKTICDCLKGKKMKGLQYLFEKYYKPLVLWADTFLNDISMSEDLVQELFIKLWEHGLYSQLRPETLRTYLYTAVHNRALNLLDKNDPIKLAFQVDDGLEFWEENNGPEEEIMHRVDEAIAKLPDRSREIVELVYLKNMKYKEVAEKLQISISTVKTLLVNSLKTLRKEFKDKNNLFLFFLIKKYQ